MRFLTKDGDWRSLQLTAIPDYDDIGINKIQPEAGAYPPGRREVLHRARLARPLSGSGRRSRSATPSGGIAQRQTARTRIAGTVHDMSQLPAFMNGAGYGYITFDTLEWLGEPRDYNQVGLCRCREQLDE